MFQPILFRLPMGKYFWIRDFLIEGIRPAVNVELSVSRVGNAAQTPIIKKMTKALRLELAQYHELLSFAQFGTELDEVSQQRLARGAIVIEILKQPQSAPIHLLTKHLCSFYSTKISRYYFTQACKALCDSICELRQISLSRCIPIIVKAARH